MLLFAHKDLLDLAKAVAYLDSISFLKKKREEIQSISFEKNQKNKCVNKPKFSYCYLPLFVISPGLTIHIFFGLLLGSNAYVA